MTRYKCPCCGRPYNGKRCRECYYETFTEEIAHGNHVHEGEPLVLSETPPRQLPRPTIGKKPDCSPYTGRKKKDSPLKWLVAVLVVLVSLFAESADRVELGDVVEVIPDFNETYSVPTNREPEKPAALENGLVLYDDRNVRIVADWEQGKAFENPITVWMENNSALELSAMTENLYVNGFLMEYSVFYCQAGPGELVQGELWLDGEELESCGITEVETILMTLLLLDQESYDTYGQSRVVELNCAVPAGFVQQTDDSGQLLYEQEGLRVICRGIRGSQCEDSCLEFYIENTGDEPAEVFLSDCYVNGEEADVFLFCQLLPGTRAVMSAQLWNLPEIGVDTVAEIGDLGLVLELVSGENGASWQQTEVLYVDLEG